MNKPINVSLLVFCFVFFAESQAYYWNSKPFISEKSNRQQYSRGFDDYSLERSYNSHDQNVESNYQPNFVKQNKDRGSSKRPHIVVIVADDLGWNDISWNNAEFGEVTPNLGKLAEEGVILDNYYAQSLCTPSRSTLLQGLYPFKTGYQNLVLIETREGGIDPSFTTLPERLRNLGYSTNAIGKWHLGFCKESFTPIKIGYNSFYGSYSGSYDDYFTKIKSRAAPGVPGGRVGGFDLRDNTGVVQDTTTYSEFLFRKRAIEIIQNLPKDQPLYLQYNTNMPHCPLQVPIEYENRFPFIEDYERRIYAAMVSILDDSVGDIVAALKQKGIWEDTLLVFISDNGGNPFFGASNYPLRGGKGSWYEGGVRVPAFVHGNFINRRCRRSQGLMHTVDWLNTFLRISGGVIDYTLDSIDVWDMISRGTSSPRTEIIHNIDQTHPIGRIIRSGDYKLISGNPLSATRFFQGINAQKPDLTIEDILRIMGVTTGLNGNVTELYNIAEDPFEINNLAIHEPRMVLRLLEKLDEYEKDLVPAFGLRPLMSAAADPNHFGGVWSSGWC